MNEYIQSSYNFTVNSLVSSNNPELIPVILANQITKTASYNEFCTLSYELHFKSGLLTT